MVEAARRNKRIVQLGTQSRSRASTQRAIEYVHSGKIGKVLAAKAWDVQLRDEHRPQVRTAPCPRASITTPGSAPRRRCRSTRTASITTGTGTGISAPATRATTASTRWIWRAGRWAWMRRSSASGSGGKLFFDDDQQTPDTINVTFRYPGNKMLMFEMRIWNPYGMEGQENGVAVYGSEGMVHIGRWERAWGYKVFDDKGKLVKRKRKARTIRMATATRAISWTA